jgi:Zinc finger, C3HC4 type (RING finger)
MPFKRKRSSSIVDLTNNASPLPLPLTTRPLGPRADSPASSMSSGSRAAKRTRQSDRVVDVDALPDPSQPVAGPSRLPREIIEIEDEAPPWREDGSHDQYDPVQVANFMKGTNATRGKNAVAGPSSHFVATDFPPATSRMTPATPPPSNLLSSHTCPICFSTVTNACLTPCGHVLCGACLFAAVKSSIRRALEMTIPMGGDRTPARYVIGTDVCLLK